MKVYTLNILLNTSNRTFGQSEQILTKKVRANGFKIVGDGRAYEFWTGDADGGAFKNKKKHRFISY